MNENSRGNTYHMWSVIFNRLLKNEGIPLVRNYFVLLFIVCILGTVCGVCISIKYPYESYMGNTTQHNKEISDSKQQEYDDIIIDDNNIVC